MPVLGNPKHELFAQAIAKGKNQLEAYVAVGYKPSEQHACRLASSGKVRARIDEILSAAADRAGVTVERVLNELALLGFSNMLDYIRVGEDGQPYTDFSGLTREQAAAIGEIVVETRTDHETGEDGERAAVPVRKVRFKLSDKAGALEKIGRHLGMFKDRIEHTGANGGPIEVTSDADVVRRMALLFAKEAGKKPDA